ncbi:MAG TPA: S8 family serine peptidase, partial [Pyrinomonadaceae bacterium]|nr:S8 family serine peptidase [Pyrinomonadaceae bacterium]
MNRKLLTRRVTWAIHTILVASTLFPTLVFGQNQKQTPVDMPSAAPISNDEFLINIAAENGGVVSDDLKTETDRVVKTLSSSFGKSPVLINSDASVSRMIFESAAGQLSKKKVVYRIDWDRLFANGRKGVQALEALRDRLSAADFAEGRAVLYAEDVSTVVRENAVFGQQLAEMLRGAVIDRKLQIAAWAESSVFDISVASDVKLRERVERIDISNEAKDPFVGDKISPDLRDLMNAGGENGRVRVILQADDINNTSLTNVLRKNGVLIEGRAENLDMMTVDVPVGALEAIAQVRGTNHLSLNREIKLLGHIETTTGTSQIRTITQGLTVGLLGIAVLNTSVELDGKGIGIAVVDSGIREDHRSFVDVSGNKRVVKSVDFTNTGNANTDKYGHGTHVASLLGGGVGQNLNAVDGLYMNNYEGIASNSKLINLKVLNEHGVGNTASFVDAMNWVYANRTQYNIRVVNLSLGAPAIETWR